MGALVPQPSTAQLAGAISACSRAYAALGVATIREAMVMIRGLFLRWCHLIRHVFSRATVHRAENIRVAGKLILIKCSCGRVFWTVDDTPPGQYPT